MQGKFVHGDPLMVDYTPSGAVAAGVVVVVGGVPLIAHLDIAAARKGALAIGGGVYQCTADGAISPGSDVFWDDTANKITQTVGSNKHFGKMIGITSDIGGPGPATDGDTCFVLHMPELIAAGSTYSGPQTISDNSAQALAVGPNGATNPVFNVTANTSSAATGLDVVGAAAAGGLNVRVISSGTNENLTINAKGSGTITLNNTGTGNIVLGRAATGVSLAVTAGLTSSGATGAGIGYATGAGGTVSQATDRTTGVTINKLCGQITTQATSLAAAALVSFTVTNSTVAIGDTVQVSIQSGPTTVGTIAYVTTVAAGSFQITLKNGHASTADTGAAVLNFAVLKSVAA